MSKMPNDVLLTDDYVADLLAKEAKDCSIQYSTMGLDAYTSKPAPKARPNTRFLRNIIRETKSHNEAILAKEAAESQARLNELARAEEHKRRKLKPPATDIRRRQLGDIAAILSGRKRKRESGGKDGEGEEQHKPSSKTEAGTGAEDHAGPSSGKGSSRDKKEDGDDRGDGQGHDGERRRHKHRRDDDGGSRDERRHRERSPHHGEKRRHRHRSRPRSRPRSHPRSHSRSRSPLRSDGESRHHKSRSRGSERERASMGGGDLLERQLSDRIGRGRLAEDDGTSWDNKDRGSERRKKRGDLMQDRAAASSRSSKHGRLKEARDGDGDDSDPLEDFIGPKPAPRPRGRGAAASASGASAMDSRFAADYDPKLDVQPGDAGVGEGPDGDWGDAVEAFRDRLKWKRQGADRLRAAGFTDEQVRRWESAGEPDAQDVRWRKAGEGREWDRGKVVGLDGDTETAPAWSRGE